MSGGFQRQGLLIVVSGPSGAGKGTVCKELMARNPNLKLSISMTTREPRPGEIEGANYFYVSADEFERRIQDNELLEHVKLFEHYYGTPRQYVKDQLIQGFDVILEIDIEGASKVQDRFDDGVFIFIVPPSMEELRDRITKRGTESREAILQRFQHSYHELNVLPRYNYVVVNDEVLSAVLKMEAIILAEKCRVSRNLGIHEMLIGGNSIL